MSSSVQSSTSSPPAGSALSAQDVGEVFHYWSTLLKYQDALTRRPRARRPQQLGVPREANVQQPEPGQEYMKLPFAGAERFLLDQAPLPDLSIDIERAQFFEDWLHARYRRSEEDESPVSELVMFPVVHLSRGELTGLLRFPARIEWINDQGTFRVPTYEERTQKRFPSGPTGFRVQAGERDPEQNWPFFLDVSLLGRTLRIESEAIESLFAELRSAGTLTPRAMMSRVCRFLEKAGTGTEGAEDTPESVHPQTEPDAAEYLARLYRAVARHCNASGRNRCYPVAILVNNQRSRATFHVQRDLAEAAQRFAAGEVAPQSPLAVYMTGRPAPVRSRPCYGRWTRAPLTASQQSALELALGSSFCAVQGPPGTGKTTLILNAVVEQWVQKLNELSRGGRMSERFMLVTSTNNRAVDNVVEPLSSGPLFDCPLSLRLGSRDVTASQTRATLQRVLAFVERQPPENGAHFEAARQLFRECHGAVERHLGPSQRLRVLESERAELQRELGELTQTDLALSDGWAQALSRLASGEAPAPAVSDEQSLGVEVPNTLRALARLSRDTESDALEARTRFEAGYKRLHNKRLKALALCFETPIDLRLPPPSEVKKLSSEACETLLEEAVSRLLDVEVALRRRNEGRASEQRRAEILERLAAITAELAQENSAARAAPEVPAGLFEALYEAALALRTCWIQKHRQDLIESLRTAISACERQRSLRAVLDTRAGPGSYLRALFPSFGCTLLSIGNAFGPDPVGFERVIVDEAGQCHSAYAVSALLRARSALVLGDTHQLEPVVGLGREDERRILRSLKLKLHESKLWPYRIYDESGHSAQSVAERASQQRPTLRDHFRCQPEIAALCESWCDYGMVSRTPPASRRDVAPELCAPVLFQSVFGHQERTGGSYHNVAELEQVVRWVRYLIDAGLSPEDLGVLTPYRGQLLSLLEAFRTRGIPVERPDEEPDENLNLFTAGGHAYARSGGVAVGTVHRFQGGERSVIVFSTTVTQASSLGFLDNRVHLLNVAASRAREHLLVFGHAATLASGRHTRALVEAGQPLPHPPLWV